MKIGTHNVMHMVQICWAEMPETFPCWSYFYKPETLAGHAPAYSTQVARAGIDDLYGMVTPTGEGKSSGRDEQMKLDVVAVGTCEKVLEPGCRSCRCV